MICDVLAESVPLDDPALPPELVPEPSAMRQRIRRSLIRLQERIFDWRHGDPWKEFQRIHEELQKMKK